uniref:uncharacterized protein LOC100175398 n=1 Tax=Ciona intestinalis TaxID=7719 RepID=UPI00006A3A42|nr:uncharacterized protein LOC100175398 [Ciona intestinalis]|eukprot:XP_002128770.1 uncharacterized protein LOC100175398 [Ciona intestinalis]
MTPLGSIFKSGATKPPKIDQHSLFTSIQVSVPILEGKLQVYEPWRRKRNRPKECHVTLYANETSPFLVWSKVDKVKQSSTSTSPSGGDSPTSTFSKVRCVLSVSRAKMCKTTGGSFELTDFASSLTFRFIADTIREANRWVEKLAEESLREANLDMRSICSSCSSFSSSTSSFSSHASPDSIDGVSRCFSASSTDSAERRTLHKKSASFSDANGAMMHLLTSGSGNLPLPLPSVGRINEDDGQIENFDQEVFTIKTTEAHLAACKVGHVRSNSKTFPRALGSRQPHIRAQPHLGIGLAVDKHRPELRNALKSDSSQDRPLSDTVRDRSGLPFSEFFVNVPNS